MRMMMVGAGLAALSLGACGQASEDVASKAEDSAPVAEAPGAMEGPRPGLWRVVSVLPNGTSAPAVETCITRATFDQNAAGAPAGADCSNTPFRREGGALVGSSVCTLAGGMRIESATRVTGDLSSRYTMEITTRTTPPPDPSVAETKMTLNAERLGDCPTGAAPPAG